MTSPSLAQTIQQVRDEALEELRGLTGEEQLETWRVQYLGRRGRLTSVLRTLGSLSPEERRSAGAQANQAKTLMEESRKSRWARLGSGSRKVE